MNDAETSPATQTDRRTLLAGLALTVVGLALALANLDLLPTDRVFAWWPLAIAGAGLYRMVTGEGERRQSGAWWLVFAGWLLLSTLHIGGLAFSNSWPLLPLLAGLFSLAWPSPGHDRLGGLILAGVGVWLWMSTRNVLGLDFGNSWPLLLVFVGLAMALGALVRLASGLTAGRRQS
jgi:hypothetical protein